MKDINRPNDTAQELDKAREESLRQAIRNTKKFKSEETKQEEEPKEESTKPQNTEDNVPDEEVDVKDTEKDNKKLDNNEDNSYIEEDDIERVLNETFGGDPKKAVKSWRESQKAFTKLYNEKEGLEKNMNQYKQFLKENPVLVELMERAEKGEDIESLIKESTEPSKVNQQTDSPKESKLDVPNNDVTEDDLIEKGFINKEFLEDLTQDERRSVVRRAKIKYLESELPRIMAEKGAEEYRKRIDEIEKQRSQKREEEKINEQISQRYDKGIDTIVTRFDLDFANDDEHRKLLDDINSFVANIRDPQNPNLIHENAVEMATEHILKTKGLLSKLDKGKKETKTETPKEEVPADGFNASRRTPRQNNPSSLSEKLDQKHRESYEKYQELNPAKRSQT